MIMSQGLMGWKRGSRMRSIVLIMSVASEAVKSYQNDKNAYSYVGGFGKLEKGF